MRIKCGRPLLSLYRQELPDTGCDGFRADIYHTLLVNTFFLHFPLPSFVHGRHDKAVSNISAVGPVGKTESGRADKGQSRDSEEIGGMHETGVGTDDDMGTVNEVAGFQ